MDAELKKKIFSGGSYVMAVANGGVGVYVAKLGYRGYQASASGDTKYAAINFSLFVALPVAMLLLCAIVPILLRKKGRVGLAFVLGAVGMAFYAVCFFGLPSTVGVVGL